MGESKEENKGMIPCMACGERKKYINTSHMKGHDSAEPQTIAEYRDWVANNLTGVIRLSIRISY